MPCEDGWVVYAEKLLCVTLEKKTKLSSELGFEFKEEVKRRFRVEKGRENTSAQPNSFL